MDLNLALVLPYSPTPIVFLRLACTSEVLNYNMFIRLGTFIHLDNIPCMMYSFKLLLMRIWSVLYSTRLG